MIHLYDYQKIATFENFVNKKWLLWRIASKKVNGIRDFCLEIDETDDNYIDGLAQDCSNSSALAIELLQTCTKPSIYALTFHHLFVFTCYVYINQKSMVSLLSSFIVTRWRYMAI